MTTIVVTGAAAGLGRATAEALLDAGHDVVVHARDEHRLPRTDDLVRRGATPLYADLADLAQVERLGHELAAMGAADAVVHNAGVMRGPAVTTVNVLAPYLLTALTPRPARLVVLSSGMHRGGSADLDALDGRGSYSDSKLLVTTLAMALARRWPDVVTSAVDPGWVPTRMGGASAPDDLSLGHVTQVWLATSDAPAALESGGYWFHQERSDPARATLDVGLQDRLLERLGELTGVRLD